MYCPARYCGRSFAGSLKRRIITSSATRSSCSTGRQRLQHDVARLAHITCFDGHITLGLATEQRPALGALQLRQRGGLMRTVFHFAIEHPAPLQCEPQAPFLQP